MGLRINTNLSAIRGANRLGSAQEQSQRSFARLAAGERITRAGDDPSGLGLSESMRSEIRSHSALDRGLSDGISLVRTASSGLGQISGRLGRMRELAVQAASGTLSGEDRAVLNAEFQGELGEVDRIAGETSFNGTALLDDSAQSVDVQTDIHAGSPLRIELPDATAEGLGNLQDLDLSTAENAGASLAQIDAAIAAAGQSQGELGAAENRLESASRSARESELNLAEAESRIRDVDYALEVSVQVSRQIKEQASAATLLKAVFKPKLALDLLRGPDLRQT